MPAHAEAERNLKTVAAVRTCLRFEGSWRCWNFAAGLWGTAEVDLAGYLPDKPRRGETQRG